MPAVLAVLAVTTATPGPGNTKATAVSFKKAATQWLPWALSTPTPPAVVVSLAADNGEVAAVAECNPPPAPALLWLGGAWLKLAVATESGLLLCISFSYL